MKIRHHKVTVVMSVTTLEAETAEEVVFEVRQEIRRLNRKMLDKDFPSRIEELKGIEELEEGERLAGEFDKPDLQV